MKSIGMKLWAGMMTLVMVMLVLLWLFQIVFLEKFYTGIRISETKNAGYSILKDYETGDQQSLKNNIDAFSTKNNVSVELLDSNGKVIYESTSSPSGMAPMMINNAKYKVLNELLTGKEVALSWTHPRFGNEFMLIGLPVEHSGEVIGSLILNMPLAPVEDTVNILKKQLLYISAILLTVALILSYIISKSFTNPLLRIIKVSEKMASGDFSDRITTVSKDEIGRLTDTINYMGEELSKIEQLRKDLIANVSHELRTPLSIIRGYAETIRDVTGEKTEKRERQLGIIIEESERLSRIVEDILSLSQMQSGNTKLNMSNFNLSHLVKTIVKRYDLLSDETGVTIKAECPTAVYALADVLRIEQVLYNLINNAFKYTDKGGSISVQLLESNNSIRIEVSDTGSGIGEEDLKYLWDRYYKVDKTGSRKSSGTGLGLAIVKSILEAHASPFGVESAIGKGTIFWFELKKETPITM
ncbi:MAG: signal transduction histidine kinase [Bacillales bacterium]|jgi:signal transduction histidine kinase|nr:signal transduction histidine kinase [Bacillales bacterium]